MTVRGPVVPIVIIDSVTNNARILAELALPLANARWCSALWQANGFQDRECLLNMKCISNFDGSKRAEPIDITDAIPLVIDSGASVHCVSDINMLTTVTTARPAKQVRVADTAALHESNLRRDLKLASDSHSADMRQMVQTAQEVQAAAESQGEVGER